MYSYSDKTLTRSLKKYDRDLFARFEGGLLHVLIKRKRPVSIKAKDGVYLTYFIDHDSQVMSLTDNWSARGNPRDWGIDRVILRLKEIDSRQRENLIEEFEAENERKKKEKEKDLSNHNEAFLHEFRDDIKKAFSDTNTSLMDKKIDPRRKFEKRSF